MSNRMFAGRARVSMESLRDEPAVAEEDAIEIATRPDPEAMEAEAVLVDASDEVIARDSDVAELTDAADTLETYRAVLEGSLEENGMDRAGAQAVQVGLDSTLGRIGTEINTPAMESYGSASNRIQATRLTLEAIGDKLKEIWEAIKRALKAAWEAVKKFFAALFDSVERTRQTAEKVKAAASSSTSTGGSIEVKGAGAKLGINGKIDSNWVATATSILGAADDTLSNLEEITNMYGAVTRFMSTASVAEASTSAAGAVKEYLGKVQSSATAFAKAGGHKAAAGSIPGTDPATMDVQMSPILLGNAVMFATSPKSSEGPLQLADTVARSKIGFYVIPVKGAQSDTVTALTSDQIVSYADAVLGACAALVKRKAVLSAQADAAGELIKGGDALINKAGADEAAAAQARQVVQSLPRLVENAGGWPKQTVSYLLGVANAGLKVAQSSLKSGAEAGTAVTNAAPAAA